MKRSTVLFLCVVFLGAVILAYQMGRASSHYDAETIRQSKISPDPREFLQYKVQWAKTSISLKEKELDIARRELLDAEKELEKVSWGAGDEAVTPTPR